MWDRLSDCGKSARFLREDGGVRDALKRLLRSGFLSVVGCLLLLVWVCGCAGSRPHAYSVLPGRQAEAERVTAAQATLTHRFPPQYRATQRAILTVGRRQYVTEGVLEVSPEAGHHLVVVSTLGLVTEISIETNGVLRVLRVTPLFREEWSRDYVGRDLRLLFAVPPATIEGGCLADGRPVLLSPPASDGTVTRYIFSSDGRRLEEIEVVGNERRVCRAVFGHYRQFPGVGHAIPTEFQVLAPAYGLELRMTELTLPRTDATSRSGVEGP